MQSGKLNDRIVVKAYTRVQDNYGGWVNTLATTATYWCELKEIGGVVEDNFGKRSHYNEIEITLRKKTADLISVDSVFELESNATQYRVNNKYDSDTRYYTTIKATRVN